MKQKFDDGDLQFAYEMRQIDLNFIYGTFIFEYIFIIALLLFWYFDIKFIEFILQPALFACGTSCVLIWFQSYRKTNSRFRNHLLRVYPWWKLKEYGGYQ